MRVNVITHTKKDLFWWLGWGGDISSKSMSECLRKFDNLFKESHDVNV